MKVIIKTVKFIIISLLILFFLFTILEIISFSLKLNTLIKEGFNKDKTIIEFLNSVYQYYTFPYKYLDNSPITIDDMRKPIIKKNNTPSIILFGCSYTYGHMLNDNETFAAVLSDYSGRSVYNLGISSTSPREILYFLQHQDLISKFIKDKDNVEYVIYTFIIDHIFRLYYNLFELSPIYKLNNDSELVYKKNTLYNATFFSREMQKVKYFQTSEKERNNLFTLYIKLINKEIKNNFKYKNKDTKVVILLYENEPLIDWKAISKLDDNIVVVNVSDIVDVDLSSEKYIISKDDGHPNYEAWKVLVPNLMKYLENTQ